MRRALTDSAHFAALAEATCAGAPALDRVTLRLEAEASDFIRFNRGAVRQATHVEQGDATLGVARGPRCIESTLALTGRLDDDIATLHAERAALASALDDVPDDPWFAPPAAPSSSTRHDTGALPSAEAAIATVTAAARGLDFVGFLASGPVVRAFADSRGQRHWHHVESFHLEGSLYRQGDQAVKHAVAGTHWDPQAVAARIAAAAARLPLFERPSHALAPGRWRAYFSPEAMAELLETVAWSGFGARARRTGSSSLGRLARGEARLHPQVTLAEDTAGGLAPAFTTDGAPRPGRVVLVAGGGACETLNSARSARQYGLPANGANADETPESLHLAAGTLPESEALAALDSGLYVSNLWYLNYSDRPACRITGMTRFACFLVEGGRPVAPLPVMRFDDSFLRMAGAGLLALTDRAERLPDARTYRSRQLRSVTTPGALVEDWQLTL